jgi:hypothetical protein
VTECAFVLKHEKTSGNKTWVLGPPNAKMTISLLTSMPDIKKEQHCCSLFFPLLLHLSFQLNCCTLAPGIERKQGCKTL